MVYPADKEDFTPVVSPEFIRDNHINELQTLLETLQDILGLFPNWAAGVPDDIGFMFRAKTEIDLSVIRPLAEGLLVLADKNSVLALAVKLGGNVGIKNNNPLVELDVTGEINSTYGFYHDRGDVAAYDFAVGDLTTDNTWRDLDLSSVVPAGAKTVSLYVEIKDDVVGSSFALRKNGNTNEHNRFRVVSQVANHWEVNDALVSCDTDRVIEYKASNLAWVGINIVVKGWWK